MVGDDIANFVRLTWDIRSEEPIDVECEGSQELDIGMRACGNGAAALAKVVDAREAKLGRDGRFCKEND